MLQKKSKICTKIDHFYVILMFAVTSYTVHSKKRNLLYYTYYQTYHFTMFIMGKMYNHRYVSKVYLYSHDTYKRSMHNKRFIILHHGWSFEPVLFLGPRWSERWGGSKWAAWCFKRKQDILFIQDFLNSAGFINYM